jgi:membrane-associated phospholipid phosphatase
MADQRGRRVLTRRQVALLGAVTALVLVGALGLLVSTRDVNPLDAEWMEEILEIRGPIGEALALVFDFIGGGWFAILVVPLGGALAFLLARRPWSALAFLIASAVGAIVVRLLKVGFGRARPEEILLPLDSAAFPSGHTTNAAIVAVMLGLLLQRIWVWVAGAAYVVLMALSRTYLGAHWLTDTIGGAILGAAIAVLVWCVFATRIRVEASGRER